GASEAGGLMVERLGRPVRGGEVKDNLAGIVDEARWTAFWTAARKNPQLLVSGGGKTATVRWTESAHASEDAVRAEFERADPVHKLDLARKQAKRSKELASWIGERLAGEAPPGAPPPPAAL